MVDRLSKVGKQVTGSRRARVKAQGLPQVSNGRIDLTVAHPATGKLEVNPRARLRVGFIQKPTLKIMHTCIVGRSAVGNRHRAQLTTSANDWGHRSPGGHRIHDLLTV